MCGPGEDPAMCVEPGAWAAPEGTTTLTLDTRLEPSIAPSPASTFVTDTIRARDPNPHGRSTSGEVPVTKFGCAYVYGSSRFRSAVADDLTRLYATTAGRNILDCYWHAHAERGHVVRIYPPGRKSNGFAYNNAFAAPADARTGDESPAVLARTWGSHSPYAVENGTGTHIYFNPASRAHYTGRPLFGTTTSEEEKESWIILCHELVHALHNAYAVNMTQSTTPRAVDDAHFPSTHGSGAEEEFTIVGEYLRLGAVTLLQDSLWTSALTENTLLAELGKPLRVEHSLSHRVLFRVATDNDELPETEDDGSGWLETGPDLLPQGTPVERPAGALGRRVAS